MEDARRDHILSEIKRVAEQMDGAAPGRRTFESATGIREKDWLGKYWARWGDALADAGLAPNTLQIPIDRDSLARTLALAVREIGKFPTKPELLLFGRSHAGFPAYNTFTSKLGDKGQMVEALRVWTASKADFADVAALLPAAPQRDASERGPSPATDGFVYLIRSGPHYKVGRSEELERRVKEIRVALPEAAVLEHAIRTDDPAGIESYWHRRFADRRANGEWFRLSVADVRAFKRRSFQ